MGEQDSSFDDLVLDPGVLVGVWANGTGALRRRDEVTIEFFRDIPELQRPVLVSRALIPLVAAFKLRDGLTRTLQSYTEWSMPEDTADG